MNESTNLNDLLKVFSTVLIWCFALSAAFILLWFCLIAFGGDLIYRLHSIFYDMPRGHFALAHYCGMAFAKVGAFGLFLFPYIGVRVVLRRRTS